MRRQLTTIAAVAGLALGPGAVTASAIAQSPDARDANLAAQREQAQVDNVDLRSPDARDAARGVGIPDVEVIAPQPLKSSSGGFDWADAGIGAGALVAIALLALGAGVGVQHHRRAPTTLAH